MSLRRKSLLVVLCMVSAQAFAASVIFIDGVSPPTAWTVDPNHPGTSEIITFSGPLNYVYSSSCTARGSLGGTPHIAVDTINREVTLSFVGPPPISCDPVWSPVSGLQGDFGPLSAGNWTFKSSSPQIPFNIPFVVGTSATTYYVDQDSPGPVHNGSNWYWAFSTIQDALAVTIPGDTILVAGGLYTPDQGAGVTPGDREASFTLQHGISLMGGYAGFGEPSPDSQNPDMYRTELSGDLAGNDLYGLLYTEENSYHVVTAEGLAAASTWIEGIVITGGRANGHSPHHMGGGLLVNGADVVVSSSLIYGNKGAFGGAVAVNQGHITLVNSQISGNSARLYGAGFYALDGSVTLTNCLITGNTIHHANPPVGSVLYGLNSSTYIFSSTITDNLPANGQVITSLGWGLPTASELTVTNSILHNSGNEIVTNHPSTTSVSKSNVRAGWSGNGTGNIDSDPLFGAPGNWSFEGEWIAGDYHLQEGSPCIDQGSTILLPPDTTDLNLNGNIAEPLPLDLDHAPRVQGSETDMGVYETETTVTPPPTGPEWIVWDQYSIIDTPQVPAEDATVTATFSVTFIVTSTLEEIDVTVEPVSAAGGDWTATFVPDMSFVGPGNYTAAVQVVGEHLDQSQLTMGVPVVLSKVRLLYRVIQP
jgi:hypothetical protein